MLIESMNEEVVVVDLEQQDDSTHGFHDVHQDEEALGVIEDSERYDVADAIGPMDVLSPDDPALEVQVDRGSYVSDTLGAGADRHEAAGTHETDETDGPEEDTSAGVVGLVPGRPVVKVVGGDIPEVLAQAQKLLVSTGSFFTNGSQIVQVVPHAVTGEVSVSSVKPAQLTVLLSKLGTWLAPVGRKGDWKRIDAPLQICNTLLQQHHFDQLQPLAGLARQPFLRPEGTVCDQPGYDPATGVYGAFDRLAFREVGHPSRNDAEAAMGRLNALLDEFPFVSPADRSAALTAMITAAIRPSLPVAPMFLVAAPGPGTGKTFLCQLVAAFASARDSVALTLPGTDSECAKVLLSQLRRAPASLLFDNLGTDLIPYDSLCAVLTSEFWSGRVLNTSTAEELSTRTLILASGNNVRPTRDMVRRCITITLDARSELPATRPFTRPNLLEEVKRNRGQYVADALTVVRAWLLAGEPITAAPALVTFDRWSAWCRQPLLWLGHPDPVASVFTVMEDDPDRHTLKNLLREWHAAFNSASVMVRDLVQRAQSDVSAAGLREMLVDISADGEELNSRRIGRWIAAHANQIADGLRLERARRTSNAEVWKVAKVSPT